MWDDFDLFSQADSIDYSEFVPNFDFEGFDSGFSDAVFDANAGFDLGGIGDGGTVDFADVAPVDFDGSYVSEFDGDWQAQFLADIQAPTDFGVSWEFNYPISADGINLPNISGRDILDVGKAGIGVYTATQSGSRNQQTRSQTTPSGASTNADSFRSIIGNITGAVRSAATAYANIEDTRQRVTTQQRGIVPRGTASGITGPRTAGTRAGNATTRTSARQGVGAGGGFDIPPAALIAGVALVAVLALRK
jgi:hypothetical protein